MINQHVAVYTSDDCVQCKKLVNKLNDWGISYEEKNVSTNKTFIKELQENKIYGTPATFIGNHKILGFQEYKLRKSLELEPEFTVYSNKEYSS